MNHEECLAYDAIDKGWGIMSCGNAYVKLRVGWKAFLIYSYIRSNQTLAGP